MTEIHARSALLPDGWARDVTVTLSGDGRIADVTGGMAGTAATRVDILLPAPGNVHSHAFQRAMAGLTERRGQAGQDSFWTWRQWMYRFLDHLTPEDVQAITAQVQVEMLRAGFASVGEFHYLHHAPGGTLYRDPSEMSARVCAAADQTGIGLTLMPVLYQQGGVDSRALEGGQRRFGNDPDRFQDLCAGARRAVSALPGDAVMGAAAHSLRAVTPKALNDLARSTTGPLHMHLAEQQAEVDEIRAAWGARPVEWLLNNAPVDDRWCLVHCTQMTPAETRALARTGAVAGLCPITEASLGDGIFDGTGWIGADGVLAVGSDSNIRISLSEELRMLEYSQRLRDRARAVLAHPGGSTGNALYRRAARGSAQALGRNAGVIAPGRLADLVALDASHPALIGREGETALDAWVFGAGNGPVRDVWSAGRHLVQDGRHTAQDKVAKAFVATMTRLAGAL